MCEGGPVLLAVLHLLHHYQSSYLHVHRQSVLLTLSYLCQLCQVNIQLYLEWIRGGLNTHTQTVYRSLKSYQNFTPLGVSKVKVVDSALYCYHMQNKLAAPMALTEC